MNNKIPVHTALFLVWIFSVISFELICLSNINGYNGSIQRTYPVVVNEHSEIIESLGEEDRLSNERNDNDTGDRLENLREKLTAQKTTTICWMIGIGIYAVVGCFLFFCIRDKRKKQMLFAISLIINVLLFACFSILVPSPNPRL